MLPTSFWFSWLSDCLKPRNFLWSCVSAGGWSVLQMSPSNEDASVAQWYGLGTLNPRTCIVFPTWHRAKPRTLQESFVLLDLNVSTRLSQSGRMLFWTSHSVRTEIHTGSFRYLTFLHLFLETGISSLRGTRTSAAWVLSISWWASSSTGISTG